MGPFKASAADTPRLAARRTTVVPACERVWSPLSVVKRPMPPALPQPDIPAGGTFVPLVAFGHGASGPVFRALAHAPLLH